MARAGVKDRGAGSFGLVDAGNGHADGIAAGVAPGGRDHAYRGLGVPLEGCAGEFPAGGGEEHRKQVGLEAVHEGLGFRVAHPHVVFEQLGSVRSKHKSGIQEAGEAGGFDCGKDDPLHHLAGLLRI